VFTILTVRFRTVGPSDPLWQGEKVLPLLRQRRHCLCPMRSRHARDNCRYIERQLPAVGVFSGHLNALIAADRRIDSERTGETPNKRSTEMTPQLPPGSRSSSLYRGVRPHQIAR